MYSSKAHDVEPITSYNKADRHFKETRAVRSIKWQEDERPLRRRSQHHYRLKHGTWQGRNFYDVIHWDTPLIRYWQPFINGDLLVDLRCWDSQSSRGFLWAHGWGWSKSLTTTTGEEVRYIASQYPQQARDWFGDNNTRFTTRLVFNANGKLKADESLMVPVFRKVSTDSNKEERDKAKRDMEMLVSVLTMRYSDYAANCRYSNGAGRSFGGLEDTSAVTHNIHNTRFLLRAHGCDLANPEINSRMEKFLRFGQAVFDTAASKRAFKDGYTRANTGEAIPTYHLNIDEFRERLTKYMLDFTGVHSTGRKPYELFAKEYPRTLYSGKADQHPDLHNELQRRYRDLTARLAMSNV